MTFIPTPFDAPVVSASATAGSAYRQVPYISVSEYQFAPTAVTTNNLVQGGGQSDSIASAATLCSRVSGWVDDFCFHTGDGTLAASVTTESGYFTVKPDGSLSIICSFRPIVALVGLGLGPLPSLMSNIDSTTAAQCAIGDKVIKLPGTWNWSGTSPSFFAGFPSYNGQVYVTWQYINGFPHMALASNATVGASSITVTPAVYGQTAPAGVYAGTQLTIRDGANTEVVVVQTTPTSTTLALSQPLQYNHTVPANPDALMISAMPWAIEEACISLLSVLAKAQGNRSLVLGKIGSPATREAASRAGALEDLERACMLLKPFQVSYLHA